jgi:hypothetical protein
MADAKDMQFFLLYIMSPVFFTFCLLASCLIVTGQAAGGGAVRGTHGEATRIGTVRRNKNKNRMWSPKNKKHAMHMLPYIGTSPSLDALWMLSVSTLECLKV